MSTDKKTDVVKAYQLKFTLRHITPLIWRRVVVKSDTTIAQMHAIIQITMCWEDLHLHLFHIHGKDPSRLDWMVGSFARAKERSERSLPIYLKSSLGRAF